ncbi:hypothetical protein L479_01574 [Exiguobacterium sp. S17]|nr:hypothetical protein L479_01574 [Exiguobacterium sp. S17]
MVASIGRAGDAKRDRSRGVVAVEAHVETTKLRLLDNRDHALVVVE